MDPTSSSLQNLTIAAPPNAAQSQNSDAHGTFQDYPLISAHDPLRKIHLLKLAPAAKEKTINLAAWERPVKLNRRHPGDISRAGKKGAETTGVEEEEKVVSRFGPPAGGPPKPGRDDSLIAPGPSSTGPKPKNQPFKKKTKQVFIAADQAARLLKREEAQPWVLEDAEGGEERWVGRFEGAVTSSSSTSATGNESNYVIFRLNAHGHAFEVLPSHRSYKFTQRPAYETLGAVEAEAAYEKLQKAGTKEDVGRWFMRRRGAGASGSGTTASGSGTAASGGAKREASVKPNLGFQGFNRSAGGDEMETETVVNGRKFRTVNGGGSSNLKMDEDEDVKPRLGAEGDFDEFDWDEDFADDDEGAGNLDEGAMEEEEMKELEERIKREMRAAGRAGDEERERAVGAAVDDDMMDIGDGMYKDDLTKEGRAVKKLLRNKTGDENYDSDGEEKNPYASEEDSDEEIDSRGSVPASPKSSRSLSRPQSRAPTPSGSLHPSRRPSSTHLAPHRSHSSAHLSSRKPSSNRPSSSISRGASPAPGGGSAAVAHRATSPRPPGGSSSVGKSRGASPAPGSRRESRVGSPALIPGTPGKHGSKRKMGPDSGPSVSAKRPFGAPKPDHNLPPPDMRSGKIQDHEVIGFLRGRVVSTKELLAHFKFRLKEEQNKGLIQTIVSRVGVLMEGQVTLKEGL